MKTRPEWGHYYPEVRPGALTAFCWNTGFGDYLKRVIDEIVRRYPLNGIFVDGLTYGDLICCMGCAETFKAEVAIAPPTVRDMDSPLYRVFKAWSYRELARYLGDVRTAVSSRRAKRWRSPRRTAAASSGFRACISMMFCLGGRHEAEHGVEPLPVQRAAPKRVQYPTGQEDAHRPRPGVLFAVARAAVSGDGILAAMSKSCVSCGRPIGIRG